MTRLKGICFLLCLSAAMGAQAQTFTTLFNFNNTDGNSPGYGSLIQGLDGNFYGTTIYGGSSGNCALRSGCGTVFKITPQGKLTTLHSFCAETNCVDGSNPHAGLIVATNGNLYGTTQYGGTSTGCPPTGCGTIFEITPGGKLTTLHSFCDLPATCADGSFPTGSLLQANNGNFYGTASGGGVNNGGGTLFELSTSNKLTTLYAFCAGCGPVPYAPAAGVIQASNGNFYGTTQVGGFSGGTVYEITLEGKLTVLCMLDGGGCGDGYEPIAGLIQGLNGNFYGTTSGYPGTVYEITAAGKLTTLYSFCIQTGCPDGLQPYGALLQATNGNFYGTTEFGGSNTSCGADRCGTVFEITPAGKLTTLHSFDDTDGGAPISALIQGTDGCLYGTTSSYGSKGYGTLFRLSLGLSPFVETLPGFAKVGTKIAILGTGLTGASSVRFNGTAATFTVVSASEITTTVPTGATSGFVEVTTPKSTLKSKVIFRVP